MWDLPRPRLEPMSPALAGRFSTTAPPGKPPLLVKLKKKSFWFVCLFWLSLLEMIKTWQRFFFFARWKWRSRGSHGCVVPSVWYTLNKCWIIKSQRLAVLWPQPPSQFSGCIYMRYLLIIAETSWGKQGRCCYSHFTDEETKTLRAKRLDQGSQLGSDVAGTQGLCL